MNKIPQWKRKIIKQAKEPETQITEFGLDLPPEGKPISALDELPQDVQERVKTVGIDTKQELRSGTYFQYDHTVILAHALKDIPGIEVMSINEALMKYDWLKDYWWKAVSVNMDKYTTMAQLKQTHGYFIRAKPNTRLALPIQACLFIGTDGLLQCPHNVIIAEENSHIHVITGCATHPSVNRGMHIGISEFYIKEGATVTFTMIHSWAENVEARPRTAVIIEKNGTFISNYICLRPVKSLQMYPIAYCIGENAKVRYHTLIYGLRNSIIDIGSRAFLRAKGARAEVTARAIAKEQSQIILRGHIVGEVEGTKAHLDCRGLLLSKAAKIHAIPELEGKVEGTDLSHEAAIGKIQDEQLYYLMARGLNQEQATALIVRGFLDPEVSGLPDHLKMEVRRVIQLTTEKVL